jgi:hypothetical protein
VASAVLANSNVPLANPSTTPAATRDFLFARM